MTPILGVNRERPKVALSETRCSRYLGGFTGTLGSD